MTILYGHALRQSALSWVIWAIALVLISATVVSAAQVVVGDPHMFTQLMTGLPKGMLALFGGPLLLHHPLEAYLNSKLLVFLPLFGALLAAFQAAGLARDLERGRADFLLALPVRRSMLVWARLGALCTMLAALWAVVIVALGLSLAASGLTVDWTAYAQIGYEAVMVDTALAAACVWAAVATRGYRRALRLGLAIAVLPIVYDMTLAFVQTGGVWRYLLPYGYYRPEAAFLGQGAAWLATIVLIPLAALLGLVAQRAFERREV